MESIEKLFVHTENCFAVPAILDRLFDFFQVSLITIVRQLQTYSLILANCASERVELFGSSLSFQLESHLAAEDLVVVEELINHPLEIVAGSDQFGRLVSVLIRWRCIVLVLLVVLVLAYEDLKEEFSQKKTHGLNDALDRTAHQGSLGLRGETWKNCSYCSPMRRWYPFVASSSRQ